MIVNLEIGQDASAVFMALSMGETVKQSRHLLVAPNCLQNSIDEEISYEKNFRLVIIKKYFLSQVPCASYSMLFYALLQLI